MMMINDGWWGGDGMGRVMVGGGNYVHRFKFD
jgi:hypothetical protein